MSNKLPRRPRPATAGERARLRAQAERALAANDIAAAARIAERAIAAGDADPMYLNLAAWQREEAGDYSAALDLLHRALAIAPGSTRRPSRPTVER